MYNLMRLEDFLRRNMLPLEPRPIKEGFYEVAEFALLRMNGSSFLRPVLSVGLHKEDDSNYLMFSEKAEIIPEENFPCASEVKLENLDNIGLYLPARRVVRE